MGLNFSGPRVCLSFCRSVLLQAPKEVCVSVNKFLEINAATEGFKGGFGVFLLCRAFFTQVYSVNNMV